MTITQTRLDFNSKHDTYIEDAGLMATNISKLESDSRIGRANREYLDAIGLTIIAIGNDYAHPRTKETLKTCLEKIDESYPDLMGSIRGFSREVEKHHTRSDIMTQHGSTETVKILKKYTEIMSTLLLDVARGHSEVPIIMSRFLNKKDKPIPGIGEFYQYPSDIRLR